MRIADVATANNLSFNEAAAAIALDKSLNTTTPALMSARGNVNATFYQLGPAFVISQQSGKSFSDVYSMYAGGQTWMQIAQNLNVPAKAYNPANLDTTSWTNDDFTNGVWQTILMNNYGLTNDDAVKFVAGKTSVEPLVVGEVVAKEDNTPIPDVMQKYNDHADWSAVDQAFMVNMQQPPNQSQVVASKDAPINKTADTSANSQTVNPPVATDTTTTTTTQTDANSNSTPTTNGQTDAANNPGNANPNPVPRQPQTTTTATGGTTGAAAGGDPIEEWQVNGGDINPYNGWAESTTTSEFALHRTSSHHHHRMRRRHHRSYRKHS
jgi:hypothetical protein